MRVGKKKHLARRLMATSQGNYCGPLTDVAEIHTDKTREQSLRLLDSDLEEYHRQATGAIPGTPLRLVGWVTWVGWLVGRLVQLGWLIVQAMWFEAPRSRDVVTL